VTYLLSTLEREGLVERIASETDRRVFHAHLTTAGEELCAVLLPETLGFVEDVGAVFSHEDKLRLRALDTLRRHLLDHFDQPID
jgi:DNA-binding MarR family transcriptional regulator